METQNLRSEKDQQLWRLAKKRVKFKNHLLAYIAVNLLFWAYWYFIGYKYDNSSPMPWPVWCTLGWGFGLFWNYRSAYLSSEGPDAVENEYNKLKNKNGN